MRKGKIFGIILITAGICIPLIYFAATSVYFPKLGFIFSVHTIEVRTEKSNQEDPVKSTNHYPDKIVIELKDGKTFEFPPGTTEDIINLVIKGHIQDKKSIKTRPVISYEYVFSFGLFLILIGIYLIVSTKRKKGGDN